MGYAANRSMNAEVSEGMTDGSHKKIVTDRGGVVEPTTYESRIDLNNNWFGITEKKVKVTPDGLLHATPNYVPNPVIEGEDSY